MPRKAPKRKLNHGLIKATYPYYINELAKTLGVHANTTRNMIERGLPIVEGSYPKIIRGEDAINFIKEEKAKSRIKLKQNEFLCFGCGRKPSTAKEAVSSLEITSPKTGNLKAVCVQCGAKMNRRISLQDLPKFRAVLKIDSVLNPLLIQGLDSSVTCETEEVRKND